MNFEFGTNDYVLLFAGATVLTTLMMLVVYI